MCMHIKQEFAVFKVHHLTNEENCIECMTHLFTKFKSNLS